MNADKLAALLREHQWRDAGSCCLCGFGTHIRAGRLEYSRWIQHIAMLTSAAEPEKFAESFLLNDCGYGCRQMGNGRWEANSNCPWHGNAPQPAPAAEQPSKLPGSFDARDWAKEFTQMCATKGIMIDEDWMVTWFANAIMAGFDERDRQKNAEQLTADEIVERCAQLCESWDIYSNHSAVLGIRALKGRLQLGERRKEK